MCVSSGTRNLHSQTWKGSSPYFSFTHTSTKTPSAHRLKPKLKPKNTEPKTIYWPKRRYINTSVIIRQTESHDTFIYRFSAPLFVNSGIFRYYSIINNDNAIKLYCATITRYLSLPGGMCREKIEITANSPDYKNYLRTKDRTKPTNPIEGEE